MYIKSMYRELDECIHVYLNYMMYVIIHYPTNPYHQFTSYLPHLLTYN